MYAFQCHHILLKLAYQIIISSIIINARESYVASKTKSLYYAVQWKIAIWSYLKLELFRFR